MQQRLVWEFCSVWSASDHSYPTWTSSMRSSVPRCGRKRQDRRLPSSVQQYRSATDLRRHHPKCHQPRPPRGLLRCRKLQLCLASLRRLHERRPSRRWLQRRLHPKPLLLSHDHPRPKVHLLRKLCHHVSRLERRLPRLLLPLLLPLHLGARAMHSARQRTSRCASAMRQKRQRHVH